MEFDTPCQSTKTIMIMVMVMVMVMMMKMMMMMMMMITTIAKMMAATVARFQGLQSTSQAAPAKYPRHALESVTHRESDLPKSVGKAKTSTP